MATVEWAFFAIETLFGLIVVFLMFDRKNVGVRVAKLEDEKVDHVLFNERTQALKAQVCLIKTDNKEDHQELKDGIKTVAEMIGKIQLSVAHMSSKK